LGDYKTLMIAGEWWHTNDYGKNSGLRYSKAALGKFVYHALQCGAEIGSIYAMNPKYRNSYVQMTIHMTPDMKAYMEEQGFTFMRPPRISCD